jgi:hypothetical protein
VVTPLLTNPLDALSCSRSAVVVQVNASSVLDEYRSDTIPTTRSVCERPGTRSTEPTLACSCPAADGLSAISFAAAGTRPERSTTPARGAGARRSTPRSSMLVPPAAEMKNGMASASPVTVEPGERRCVGSETGPGVLVSNALLGTAKDQAPFSGLGAWANG